VTHHRLCRKASASKTVLNSTAVRQSYTVKAQEVCTHISYNSSFDFFFSFFSVVNSSVARNN